MGKIGEIWGILERQRRAALLAQTKAREARKEKRRQVLVAE